MNLIPILAGLSSYIGPLHRLIAQFSADPAKPASYYLHVWLKHLAFLRQAGMSSLPKHLVELGPGEALGVGVAALLCGVQKYTALDAVPRRLAPASISMIDEIARLLERREVSSPDGWPQVEESVFRDILDELIPTGRIPAARLDAVRSALSGRNPESATVQVIAPWADHQNILSGFADTIVSHAVLEHVTDLPGTYRAMAELLKPGGYMSHHIDLKCHGMSKIHNGHLAFSPALWKLVVGRKPFLINREPRSRHLDILRSTGLHPELVFERMGRDGLKPRQLARVFQHLSEEDINCANLYFVAMKAV